MSSRSLLLESYKYREVFFNILSQDLKVKYKRTALGYFWSLLNPFFNLTVQAVVFSHLVRLGMKDYTLFLFSGLIPWTFHQQTAIASSMCLLENENFIKKIYLPKLLFPLTRVGLRFIDFVFSMLALTIIGAVIGFPVHSTYALVPFAILLLLIYNIGIACICSVATVFFRDVQYLVTVVMQLLYFCTPILYPIDMLPQQYHFWLKLNPIYYQIHIFQKLIYLGEVPGLGEWAAAIGVALSMFGLGIWLLTSQDQELVFRM